MVNTFLTAPPDENGYEKSAKNLDKSRLWKQVLEARQILDLVQAFHVLGEMFHLPCPKNPYKVHSWIREVYNKYKVLDHYLFLHQGKYIWFSKKSKKPLKVKYDEEYEILSDGNILYKGIKYPKYTLVLPGDYFYSLGFWSHPCVVCWMNHPDSLKLYINSHIDEFLSRGGKSATVKLKYKVKKNVEHPIFALDSSFHLNHKAALLTKEFVRDEKPWYRLKSDFKFAYDCYKNKEAKGKSTSDFPHYIWVFVHDQDNPRYDICENEDGSCICSFKTYSRSDQLVV